MGVLDGGLRLRSRERRWDTVEGTESGTVEIGSGNVFRIPTPTPPETRVEVDHQGPTSSLNILRPGSLQTKSIRRLKQYVYPHKHIRYQWNIDCVCRGYTRLRLTGGIGGSGTQSQDRNCPLETLAIVRYVETSPRSQCYWRFSPVVLYRYSTIEHPFKK